MIFDWPTGTSENDSEARFQSAIVNLQSEIRSFRRKPHSFALVQRLQLGDRLFLVRPLILVAAIPPMQRGPGRAHQVMVQRTIIGIAHGKVASSVFFGYQVSTHVVS